MMTGMLLCKPIIIWDGNLLVFSDTFWCIRTPSRVFGMVAHSEVSSSSCAGLMSNPHILIRKQTRSRSHLIVHVPSVLHFDVRVAQPKALKNSHIRVQHHIGSFFIERNHPGMKNKWQTFRIAVTVVCQFFFASQKATHAFLLHGNSNGLSRIYFS